MSPSQAAEHTAAKYLAQAGALGTDGSGLTVDGWTPPDVGDVAGFSPTFVVAADGSGTHTTLQAAIDAVPALAQSTVRHFILMKPGTYREVVCANGKAPVTLYGAGPDASAVAVVAGHYNAEPKVEGTPANPCNPNAAAKTYGTSGSASVAIYSDQFHAKNITFANDAMKNVANGEGYPEGASGRGGAQAVALMTQGDRLVFDNVRVVGHQDSLYVKTANTGTVARAYFRKAHVEGDVDFIFGRGTAVFDQCRVHYVSTRLPAGASTAMLAPSTSPLNRYGMLFVDSDFTADTGAVAGAIHLGRAWDEGVNATTNPYVAGVSPNGQLLVRDSRLGVHIQPTAPWTTSTSGRAWTADGNRFAEYRNTQAP
jgi:pectinesterase